MDSIIYTDGRNVKVTTNEFISGDTNYRLDGIIDARLNFIRSNTVLPLLFVLLGLVCMAAAWFHLFNSFQIDDMHIGTYFLTLNRVTALAGLLLILVGLFWFLFKRDKYAVHIRTAEGEKEPVVSTKKDYVSQIVSAINT